MISIVVSVSCWRFVSITSLSLNGSVLFQPQKTFEMKVNISGTEFVVLENVKTVDTNAVVLKVKKQTNEKWSQNCIAWGGGEEMPVHICEKNVLQVLQLFFYMH